MSRRLGWRPASTGSRASRSLSPPAAPLARPGSSAPGLLDGRRTAEALATLRARPHQLVVLAAVAGLLAGPRGPGWVALACGAALAVAAWPAPPDDGVPRVAGRRDVARVAGVAAVLAGAWAAEARLGSLDPGTARAALGRAVAGEVVLLEAARARSGGRRAAVVRWRGDRVLLRTPDRVPWPAEAATGDVLAVRGRLAALGPHDAWLRPRHVHAVLVAGAVARTGRRRGGVLGTVDGVRRRAEAALARGVPQAEGALLQGMVLGQDARMSEAAADAFRRTGLSHLTAASGSNVLLLAALAVGVAVLLGLGARARAVLVLALIALYVPLAGGGPSIQRAGAMGAAGVAAVLAGRPAVRWHALGLAALATLLLNPRAAEEAGWQLSFAAVLAILLLAPRLRDGLRRRGVPRPLAEAGAVTVAATVGTAPLVALLFERTSLVALPANVLVTPLVAPAMWLGALAGTAGQLSATAAAPLAVLAALPAAAIGGLAALGAAVPGAEAEVPAAVVAAVCGLLAVAVVAPRVRRALPVAGLVLAVVALAVTPAPARPPDGARAVFLDVGQGDATLLQDGRHAVLVDTGRPGAGVVEALRAAGAHRLDVLVATHAQADHIGAAAEVLRALPVGVVLDGRGGVRDPHGDALVAEARRRGVRLVAAQAGQRIAAGRVVLDVRWPPPGAAPAGTDPNDRAVVAEARAGDLEVLLTADAESHVLARLGLGPTDVLKVAHHGSGDEGLPRLLEAVRPRLAVIGVGKANPYGHPARATLMALRAAGVPTLRTDRDGTVAVTAAGAGGLAVERRR